MIYLGIHFCRWMYQWLMTKRSNSLVGVGCLDLSNIDLGFIKPENPMVNDQWLMTRRSNSLVRVGCLDLAKHDLGFIKHPLREGGYGLI